MENLLVCVLFYLTFVILLYPRPSEITTPAIDPCVSIDYFPEPLEEPAKPEPFTTPAPKAIAATVLTTATPVVTAKPEPVEAFTVTPDLTAMPIRQLYQAAKLAGITNVKRRSKSELLGLLKA